MFTRNDLKKISSVCVEKIKNAAMTNLMMISLSSI
jgi:hypothetical protein